MECEITRAEKKLIDFIRELDHGKIKEILVQKGQPKIIKYKIRHQYFKAIKTIKLNGE